MHSMFQFIPDEFIASLLDKTKFANPYEFTLRYSQCTANYSGFLRVNNMYNNRSKCINVFCPFAFTLLTLSPLEQAEEGIIYEELSTSMSDEHFLRGVAQ